MIYKAVAQSILLYRIEIWVVTGKMLQILEGFHHREERWIIRMMATHGAGREWEYHPVVAAMDAAGLHPIEDYTRR